MKTFSINTRNLAATEYEGFSFNSLCVFEGKLLGASAQGLFLLEGETDDGADIDASISLAVSTFTLSAEKRINSLWIRHKTAGPMQLSLSVDDGVLTDLPLTTVFGTSFHAAKISGNRDLKGMFWGVKLANTAGADFILENIEAIVTTLGVSPKGA